MESTGFLAQAVALVVGGAVIAYICHRLRILPIVGFLLAGVILGPGGLALVRDAELIELAAEIGVVLLLFTLGIEFSLDRMRRIQRAIFIGGPLQVVLTTAAVALGLRLLEVSWPAAVFTGFLVALSSTAIVLKVLGEDGEGPGRKGQAAIGILIFQDLAVVALVLIVPILGGEGGSPLDVVRETALAAAIIMVVLVAARRVMPWVLEQVARTCSQEVFLLSIVAICFGTAWLTNLAGVSLSLGAFLAGLVVSESRFSHQAFAEILPLQILFSAVFFVSVGLLLDVGFVVEHPLLIATVIAAVIVLKVLAATASAIVLRYPLGLAISAAFLLAQIGEFSFVLERVGRDSGLYPAGTRELGGQTFLAAAVILMMITPLLARAGKAVEERFGRAAAAIPPALADAIEPAPDLENHVVVTGYGSRARYLTRVLRDSGIPFIIATLSPTGASEAERDRLRVILGDYTKRLILDRTAIDRAKMLVVPDDALDVAERVTAIARSANPTLSIVVRTPRNTDVDRLLHAGADHVLVDEIEVGVQLFTRVLTEYQIGLGEIEDYVATVRANGYTALRRGIPETPIVVCENLTDECFDTRTFTLRTAKRTGELNAAGLKVVTVRRGRDDFREPGDDFSLQPGDHVSARGSAEAFTRAAPLLRAGRVIALTDEQRHHCKHAESVRPTVETAATGCEECLRIGDTWVHLRVCMTCAKVHCCDSSKNRHATRHFEAVAHPVIRSYERGEEWAWCFPDKDTF
jgi:CPA2 family monovalent cation:H+ antiporter-2